MSRTVPRQRRYVSPGTLTACRPVLTYDQRREAYVLRAVGGRFGPVLRKERRGRRAGKYIGPERRGAGHRSRTQGRALAG